MLGFSRPRRLRESPWSVTSLPHVETAFHDRLARTLKYARYSVYRSRGAHATVEA